MSDPKERKSTPSVEALNLAMDYVKSFGEGASVSKIISVAGAFDAYLSGEIEVRPTKVTHDVLGVTIKLESSVIPGDES